MLVDATSGAGGLRFDPTQVDVYYFAPQKCFGSDGGLWLAACSPAAIARIERIAATGRWVPPSLDLGDRARAVPPRPDLQHARARDRLPARRTRSTGCSATAGSSWCASRCDRSAEILYGWAEASTFATPFVEKPDERSHVTATIDFDEAVDAAARARRCAPTASSTPSRTASSVATSCASGIFPAVEPDDVATLTRAIDWLVERLT